MGRLYKLTVLSSWDLAEGPATSMEASSLTHSSLYGSPVEPHQAPIVASGSSALPTPNISIHISIDKYVIGG